MAFIPESPRWLARHGYTTPARRALCRLRGVPWGGSGAGAADAEAGERRGEGGEQERSVEAEFEGILSALEKEREGAGRGGGDQQEGVGGHARQLLQPSCFKPLMVSEGGGGDKPRLQARPQLERSTLPGLTPPFAVAAAV